MESLKDEPKPVISPPYAILRKYNSCNVQDLYSDFR